MLPGNLRGECAGLQGDSWKVSDILVTSGHSRTRGVNFQSGEGIRLFIEAPKGIAAGDEGLSDLKQAAGAEAGAGGAAEHEFFILPVHGSFHGVQSTANALSLLGRGF